MWSTRCQHCDSRELFGVGRIEGLSNLGDGIVLVTWRCSRCGDRNELLTGNSIDAAAAGNAGN